MDHHGTYQTSKMPMLHLLDSYGRPDTIASERRLGLDRECETT